MRERFYMFGEQLSDLVRNGDITLEEAGFVGSLANLVDARKGSILTNFKSLAIEVHKRPHQIKYICDRLKDRRLIYFETSQGKRSKSLFFVMGRELAPNGVVTPEFIEKTTNYSEVKFWFQKSQNKVNQFAQSGCNSGGNVISEVPYNEKEKEKEKEKENEMKRDAALQPLPLSKELQSEIFEALKSGKGLEYAQRYFAERGYPIP